MNGRLPRQHSQTVPVRDPFGVRHGYHKVWPPGYQQFVTAVSRRVRYGIPGGLHRTGTVWIPRSKPAGYPDGRRHGSLEIKPTGNRRIMTAVSRRFQYGIPGGLPPGTRIQTTENVTATHSEAWSYDSLTFTGSNKRSKIYIWLSIHLPVTRQLDESNFKINQSDRQWRNNVWSELDTTQNKN